MVLQIQHIKSEVIFGEQIFIPQSPWPVYENIDNTFYITRQQLHTDNVEEIMQFNTNFDPTESFSTVQLDLEMNPLPTTFVLPIYYHKFLVGLSNGFIQYRLRNEILQETKLFDDPILLIEHVEEEVYLVQSVTGEIRYFRARDEPQINYDLPVASLNILQYNYEVLADVGNIAHVLISTTINSHVLVSNRKLVFVKFQNNNILKDEYTFSSRILAAKMIGNKIICVFKDRIETVFLLFDHDTSRFSFDQDISEIVRLSTDITKACFLKDNYTIIASEVGNLIANQLNFVAFNYNAEVLCYQLIDVNTPVEEAFAFCIVPAYDEKSFVCTYYQFLHTKGTASKFTLRDVPVADDEPIISHAAGGGAPQPRASKRPLLKDDASYHAKKAYVLDVLQTMSKEDREAILTLMTPEMQEELKEDQCAVCLRKYNSTKDIGENGSIVQDTEAITATIGECGHDMCTDCEDRVPNQYIREEGKRGKRCPTCRKVFREAEITLLLI